MQTHLRAGIIERRITQLENEIARLRLELEKMGIEARTTEHDARIGEINDLASLRAVDSNPAISRRGLASEVGCANSTAHKIFERLTQRGWIKRKGRGTVLTKRGKEILDGRVS